jgi:hypothetical protein
MITWINIEKEETGCIRARKVSNRKLKKINTCMKMNRVKEKERMREKERERIEEKK